LVDGGYATWKKVSTNSDGSTVGPVSYDNVRWEFIQKAFGWSALQHVIYFRGDFTVETEGVYLATFSSVISFKIDNTAYVGNVYAAPHASHSAIYLSRGVHRVYVSTVMDVRLFGGSIPPHVHFTGSLTPIDLSHPHRGIIHFPSDVILPEIMDSTTTTTNPDGSSDSESSSFITKYASVTLLNANVSSVTKVLGEPVGKEGKDGFAGKEGWVQVAAIKCHTDDGTEIKTHIPTLFSIKLAPGQIYPVPISLDLPTSSSLTTSSTPSTPLSTLSTLSTLTFSAEIISLETGERFSVPLSTHAVKTLKRKWGDVYRVTYVGYDGSVQY
ncbi:hypothetical protein HK102_010725, partial [Quaeritorhiza haematococci]